MNIVFNNFFKLNGRYLIDIFLISVVVLSGSSVIMQLAVLSNDFFGTRRLLKHFLCVLYIGVHTVV